MEWGLQGPANCTFCNRHPETNTHLFLDCSYTSIVWAALGRITQWDAEDREILSLRFLENCQNKEVKVLIIALTTHIIWKERNNTKHNPSSRMTNQFGLVRQICAKLKGRLKFEGRNPNGSLIQQLRDLVLKFDRFFSTAGTMLPD